ncbi:hypothetical protein [Blautia obeum]|uniref:hypothetical protein n=1 Tax=Blautia obeum TaxID=40520 RepID=UPI001D0840EA|nr:hypothetical protein [Blautia obeum]MCB7341847.1 hypothetical protein [Blautia obeum]
MLKDRVKISDKIFSVFEDPKDKNKQAFYCEFTLRDTEEEQKEYKKIEYWQAGRTYGVSLESGKSMFIRVIEKSGEQILDTFCFYHSGGRPQGELQFDIRPKRFYGRGAHMITVEWVDCEGEAINSQYIKLQNDDTKERYPFLKKCIEPMNPDGKKLQDKYVFVLPEGESLNDYSIWADPLVREKYKIG